MVKMESAMSDVGTAAILEVLQEWGISGDYLMGCCFDTTSANSGANNGIVVRMERAMQKKLLHFYCRHHVYERLNLLLLGTQCE